MKRILIAPVRFYQRFISPAFPPSCRFEPTCSNYMIQAIEKHGFKGVLMGLARIFRCHPWSPIGKDPVPDHFSLKRNQEKNNPTSPDVGFSCLFQSFLSVFNHEFS